MEVRNQENIPQSTGPCKLSMIVKCNYSQIVLINFVIYKTIGKSNKNYLHI